MNYFRIWHEPWDLQLSNISHSDAKMHFPHRLVCWLEIIKKETRKRSYENCYGIETLAPGQTIHQLSRWEKSGN